MFENPGVPPLQLLVSSILGNAKFVYITKMHLKIAKVPEFIF